MGGQVGTALSRRQSVQFDPRIYQDESSNFQGASSIAAFFVNGIGDHVLVLPALRALTAMLPGKVTLICTHGPPLQPLFADLPLRACVHVPVWLDDFRRPTFDAAAVARRVGACGAFFSMVTWHSPDIKALSSHLGSTVQAGFAGDWSLTVPRSHMKHSFDQYFDIPRSVWPNLLFDDFTGSLKFCKATHTTVSRVRSAARSSATVLAVHAESSREKMWPLDRLAVVLERFLARHDDAAVLVVSKESQRLNVRRFQDRVVYCSGLPLAVAFGLVAEADLFIGVDSCMLHVADLCRVPSVGLFGPTRAAEWGLRFAPHRHIVSRGTMAEIGINEVHDALEALSS